MFDVHVVLHKQHVCLMFMSKNKIYSELNLLVSKTHKFKHTHAQMPRDPRFEEACGPLKRELFEQSYSFIKEIRLNERKVNTHSIIRFLFTSSFNHSTNHSLIIHFLIHSLTSSSTFQIPHPSIHLSLMHAEVARSGAEGGGC